MAIAAAAFAELPVAGSSGRRGRLPVMAAGVGGVAVGRPASRGQSREALRSLKSLFASPEVAWQTPWKGFLAWDRVSLCLPAQM